MLAANCRVIFNRFDTDSVRNIKEAEKLAKAQGRPVAKQADDATPGFLSKAEVRAGAWVPRCHDLGRVCKCHISIADLWRYPFLAGLWKCAFPNGNETPKDVKKLINFINVQFKKADMQRKDGKLEFEEFLSMFDECIEEGYILEEHFTQSMAQESQMSAQLAAAKMAAEHAGQDTQFVQNQDLSYLQNVASRTDDEQSKALMDASKGSGMDVVNHGAIGMTAEAKARLAAHDGTDNELTAEQKVAKKAAENAGKDTQFVQNQDLSGLQKIGSRTDDGDGLATAGGAKAK